MSWECRKTVREHSKSHGSRDAAIRKVGGPSTRGGSARLVLLEIADNHYPKWNQWHAWPGIDTASRFQTWFEGGEKEISEHTGLSVTTVSRAIGELVKLGELSVVEHGAPQSAVIWQRRSSLYEVLLPWPRVSRKDSAKSEFEIPDFEELVDIPVIVREAAKLIAKFRTDGVIAGGRKVSSPAAYAEKIIKNLLDNSGPEGFIRRSIAELALNPEMDAEGLMEIVG